jgi:signal transduction histidine kinase
MKPGKLLRSSTFRLALIYMVLFASSVMVLLGFLYWSTVAYMSKQTDATITAEVTGLDEQYRQRGLDGLIAVIRERLERDPDSSLVYLLTTPEYKPLIGNLSTWPDIPPTSDGWLNFEFKDSRAGGRAFRARARPFTLKGGLQLLVGRDIRELEATQQLIIQALLWGIAITLGLALVGGIAMSRSMLRRIELINHTSREIIAGDLSRRIPMSGRADDFDQLAANLNSMLDEIQRLMEGIRHVSDNIAHDLRTPLTRLRNRLEQLLTDLDTNSPQLEQVERSIVDADQLLSTFAALLRIARIESGGHTANFISVDLAQLVQDALELYEALAEDKQVTLSTKVDTPVFIEGDRDLLFQSITNLLDNAVKYTPMGGHIELSIQLDDGVAELIVADNGPGIPGDEHDKVTQRFYRMQQSRSTPGNGLGLSLVQAVAKLHHAGFALQDNRPGLRASLRFKLDSHD